MVQKFQSPVRVYKHPFELVMKAYECRFPKCPQMPIVLDCEIVKDEVLENGAKRNTSRRCKLAVDAPYIFKKLIGVDFVYFLQHNYLDMANRTLNIEAVNESFSSRIEIFERCRYYAHPDNPEWTCFDQTATLDIKNFFGFEHSMEKMGMKQYTQTTLKGKEIIEYFINELKEKGVTNVERWVPPVDAPCSPTTREASEEPAQKLKDEERRRSSHDVLLDGDFIAKNLGTLTPMQASKLLELRKMLNGVEDLEQMPSYQTILRFLTARDWHVNQACTMLKDSLNWRKEHNIDTLVKDYKAPAVVVNHFPGAWHHHDKDGRPIYILRLGHMDVKGLLKSIGTEGLLKLTLHICEEGMQRIKESAEKLGQPVLSWCMLVDLEGLSMRHLWRPGVKALLNIIETVERNYPETMGRVLVVRAPRVFPIAWTIVSAFIHENTRSKFLFYGGPDCLHMKDGLEQYIDSEIIPDFLGGPCKTLIHEGGLVPKTLYKMNSLEDDDAEEEEAKKTLEAGGALMHDHRSLYKTVELRTGYIHEVIIPNEDPKSVLTWDFDVMRSDLHFTLYRATKELPPKTDTSVSIFDMSDFVEGEHYFKEEPTLICRHRESVQGSHVMHHTHSYIMQWFSPSSGAEGPAQLNFFYEVLSSANYKGSMTSLQSGFSSSSAASSCQSR
ncbi:protein real-time [Bactrocera neohumeralis]|uniref:protein real-time n=1 Tax=Bactrocera neohumeralis TaxID=98809 RepID=UPI0021654C62|nr:protein real-time [Bactrocera neohumeralis]XP_050318701.1 protein real-time [Bactrocera neohumeralis]XP_050318702.1 protein real-time [Bactrocera neohumeralis]XP_050318703.1 protein real-time [Bactrocera neohumeralis]